MKKEFAKKWVEALRSGKYKQGNKFLNFGNKEFCCIGVACEIAGIKKSVDKNRALEKRVYSYGINKMTTMMPSELKKISGLHGVFANRKDGKGIIINGESYTSLAAANDRTVSFNDISDYIENNWEAL